MATPSRSHKGGGGVAVVKEVKTFKGDATVVMVRGKPRHGFDFDVTLAWECTFEGDGEDVKPVKGTVHIPEASRDTVDDDEVEIGMAVREGDREAYLQRTPDAPEGEPANEDLQITHLVSAGDMERLFTFIDDEAARRIAAMDYLDVQISIDGLDETTNDAVRGTGTHATALAAARRLADAGMRDFKLSVVVTRHNVDQLDGLLALAELLGRQPDRADPLRHLDHRARSRHRQGRLVASVGASRCLGLRHQRRAHADGYNGRRRTDPGAHPGHEDGFSVRGQP